MKLDKEWRVGRELASGWLEKGEDLGAVDPMLKDGCFSELGSWGLRRPD